MKRRLPKRLFPALQGGSTMIELLVVIGILGILASIVMVGVNPAREYCDALDAERTFQIRQMNNSTYRFLVRKWIERGNTLPRSSDGAMPVCRDGVRDDPTCIPMEVIAVPGDELETNPNHSGFGAYMDDTGEVRFVNFYTLQCPGAPGSMGAYVPSSSSAASSMQSSAGGASSSSADLQESTSSSEESFSMSSDAFEATSSSEEYAGMSSSEFFEWTSSSEEAFLSSASACAVGYTQQNVPEGDSAFAGGIAVGNDPSGYPLLAFHDGTHGGDDHVKLILCREPECDATSPLRIVRTITTLNNIDGKTDVAVPADGLPVIAYRDAGAGRLMLARCNDTSCSSATTTAVTSGGENVSLVIGSDRLPLIAHYDPSTSRLMVTKCGNTACNTGNVHTAIATGVNEFDLLEGRDNLGLLVYAHVDGDLRVVHCENASCSTFGTKKLTTGASVRLPSVAQGAVTNDPIIAYFDDGAVVGTLTVIQCGNVNCNIGNMTNTLLRDYTVARTAIDVGGDELPVVAYSDGGHTTVIHCLDISCSLTESTEVPACGDTGDSGLTIGGDGFPFLFHDHEYLNNIFTTHCGAYDCQSSGWECEQGCYGY